eukprot:SAG31_NODE_17666_length_662_cov_0.909414_2_plen_64_part_01
MRAVRRFQIESTRARSARRAAAPRGAGRCAVWHSFLKMATDKNGSLNLNLGPVLYAAGAKPLGL